MAAFKFKTVATGGSFHVLMATPAVGDAHPYDAPATGWDCVSFTSKGHCSILDKTGTVHSEYYAGDLANVDSILGEPFIAIARESLDYFCIHKANGESYSLPANGSIVLTEMMNKRVFMASSSGEIDGTLVEKHGTALVETKDTVTITAGSEGLVFATFWEY